MSLFSTLVKFTVAHLAILNWPLGTARVDWCIQYSRDYSLRNFTSARYFVAVYAMTCCVLISFICSHIAFVQFV